MGEGMMADWWCLWVVRVKLANDVTYKRYVYCPGREGKGRERKGKGRRLM